ncbi:MAG TPA: hypothetical protein VIZ64_06460 [Dokdonella sp.]
MRGHRWLWLALVACAGGAQAAEREDAELAIAQASAAVQAAERADALLHAAPEATAAREHLHVAEHAYARRDWLDSTQAAEKARLDADLATALTRERRASAARAEVEAGVRDLRVRRGLPAGGAP